jgi:uncharacterized protein (DUF1330 family)
MSAYLINHLRIPGGIPNEVGLSYLEQVEATTKTYGRWRTMGEVKVVEGTWPGSAVLIEFASIAHAETWYRSPEYQKILSLRTRNSIRDLILVEGCLPGSPSQDSPSNSVPRSSRPPRLGLDRTAPPLYSPAGCPLREPIPKYDGRPPVA